MSVEIEQPSSTPEITVSGPLFGQLTNEELKSLSQFSSFTKPASTPSVKNFTSRQERPVGKVTEQHLKEISQELGLIKLCWTEVPVIDFDDRVHYPWSYQNNSEKEKLLLWYAENFRKQYNFKYPKRRPLLLACENECGVQKMVCTTIRPTTIKYPEFQTWQGCAKFVADHLTYEVLDNPTVLPDRINSPHEVLNRQTGHCFEYATLLASFLIAAAYDAYVVSGYATREICSNDQSRTECPFLTDEKKVEEVQEVEEDKKYFLRPPKDLRSQFILEMEAREIQKEKDAQRAQELAELAAIKEFEKPWPDDLGSWRLHSWVVILPSKDVSEPIFIESVTGVAKSLSDSEYHGIESIWNHQNYWVLVQFEKKTTKCEEIHFDLNDLNYWEHLLIGEPFTTRVLPPEVADAEPEEIEREKILAEKHLDMSASWVYKLALPHSEYEKRYPGSRKVTHYRKSISEQYAPYIHTDGLLERVTRYADYECEDPKDIRERYEFRSDLLYYSQKSIEDHAVHERFRRGREDALKEHYYYSMDNGIEVRFTLEFYDEARLDGLSKLVMDPLYMMEYFQKRTDFLYFRHVIFAERGNSDAPFRDIVKITEKYHRNANIRADLDVAMVEFFFPERRVYLKFHYEEEHITQTHREFKKPAPSEMGDRLTFDPSLTSGYLTGPTVPEPKPLYLYRLQSKYFKDEEDAVKRVRDRENELLCLLRLRAQELAAPRLLISEFDEERNKEAKEGYKERERKIKESKERDLDLSCDFLAPYYARAGIKPDKPLTQKVAEQMFNDCLQDWKTLLVNRANDIQQQFEMASQELQEKNNWYERNQGSLTKEEEEEYFDFCKKRTFFLHTLEVRLNRHRELAPQRYLAMEAYLKGDPRLGVAFHKPPMKKQRSQRTPH